MQPCLKILVVLAVAIASRPIRAQPVVFDRGDSIVVAMNEAVYSVSKHDSVFTPWPGSDRVASLCGSGIRGWANAAGGKLFALRDFGLCLVGPEGTRGLSISKPTGLVLSFGLDPEGRLDVNYAPSDWQATLDTNGRFRLVPLDSVAILNGKKWKTSREFLERLKPDGRVDSLPLPRKDFSVSSVAVDVSGWILVTDRNELYAIRKDSCLRVNIPDASSPLIVKLHTDPSGRAWVLTETGLFRFQDSSLVKIAEKRVYGERFSSVVVDSSGVPWVATAAGDLLHWKGGRWEGHRVNLHKPADPKVRLWTNAWIPDLLESVLVRIPGPHGRIWAVYGNRVLQWEADSLKVLDTPLGKDSSSNIPLSVMALSENDITIQSSDLKQWRWNGTDWKSEKPTSTFLGFGAIDANGVPWMGTWDGLLWKGVGSIWEKVDPKETSNSFRSGVSDVLATADGDLYFATDSGIVARRAGNWDLQGDAKKCRRVEMDRSDVLFRLCDDQWAIGDGKSWSVLDTARGFMPSGLFAAAGDSTVWFYRNGLKVWVRGTTVPFPILTSSLTPDVRSILPLEDGRMAMAGPHFFAIREPFSLSEVGVGIGTGAARASRWSGAAIMRNGRLELSGLPVGKSTRVKVFGADGRIRSSSVVEPDPSGLAVLSRIGTTGRVLGIRVEPQDFPAWSTNVVCFP